jgi:hypothetical protein
MTSLALIHQGLTPCVSQVLMNQQSDQRALAELQVTKEANAREQSELETQLAAALASSQGMVAVDNELGQSSRSSTCTHRHLPTVCQTRLPKLISCCLAVRTNAQGPGRSAR